MLRARVVWTSPTGGPYLSTFHFNPIVDSQVEADGAATAIAAFLGSLDAEIDSNTSWSLQTQMGVIDPVTGNQTGVFVVAGATGSGGEVGDMAPAAAQGLIRWNTGGVVDGRVVRGKMFVPSVGGANSAEGRLSTTAIASMLAAATTFVDNSTLAVWSRPKVGPPAVVGSAHTVLSAAIWNQFAMLTSRRD